MDEQDLERQARDLYDAAEDDLQSRSYVTRNRAARAMREAFSQAFYGRLPQPPEG